MKLLPALKDETLPADEAPASPPAEAPVLIGFDGAEGGWDALELGRAIATVRGSRCIVAAPDEAAAAEAQAALGGPATETREIGSLSPQMQLIECAKQAGAGTLAIGSSRRGRVGRALLGSVVKQVLHGAPCEVAVAPRGYAETHRGGFGKIAVALDGTPESQFALTRAEDLARQAGARIEVLVASGSNASGIEAGGPGSTSDVPEADVDLLVCGSRRPLDRIRLGSMADQLIAAAPCPILAVRRPR